MASKWPVVRVEDVCSLIVDCVNKTAPVVGQPTPFRMIRTTNVRNGRIDLSDCKFVNEETFKVWTRRADVRAGDVILTREAPIGEVGFVPEQEGLFLGQRLMQYRADQSKLDQRFLLYSFLSPHLQHQFGSHEGSGSVVSHIRVGDCFKFEMPLPPLDIQRKIGQILGALDDKIDVNRRINQTLEAMAQAIFKSWFVDFDPVKAKIAAKAEGRDPLRAAMTAISGKPDAELDTLPPDQFTPLAATAALFPEEMEDSEQWEIPKGWVATPLDGVASFVNGLALQKFPPESTTEYLPVIKIAQLRAGHTQGADRAAKSVKPEYVVQDGDVLFSWSGSLEVDFWTGGAGALNQHLFKVTSQHQPKWFYFLATRHHLPQFREIAANKATTMGHIQRRHLSEALIAVAPTELMSRATELIDPIVGEMIAVRLQSRELAVTRDALLPKLLSGELQVQYTKAEAVE